MWTSYDLGWLCLGLFSYGVTLKELGALSTLNLYRRDKALNLNDPVFDLPAPIVLYNSCSFNNFKNNEKPMRKSVNRPPTPDAVEGRQEKELTLQEIINIKLTETGEKERLMELLRERLIDCGWKDEMRALCRAFIKKKGRNNVTVDDLVHVITPNGRASIPDSIKAELLQRIRTFLVQAVV